MNRTPNGDKITTFKEVMDWIIYDWDYNYSLNKDEDGNFYVNKLYIEPKYLTYKTECYELNEGLYNKVDQLYTLISQDVISCPFCTKPCGNSHCAYGS